MLAMTKRVIIYPLNREPSVRMCLEGLLVHSSVIFHEAVPRENHHAEVRLF